MAERGGPAELPPGHPGPAPAIDQPDEVAAAGVPSGSDGPDPTIPQGRRTFWNVVLIVDLVVIAGMALNNLFAGILLGPLQNTTMGQAAAEQAGNVSAADLWIQNVFLIVLFGLVPLAWAIGTRGRRAWDFLRLRARPWEPALGAGIGIGLLLVIAALSAAYVVFTEGSDALTAGGLEGAESPVTEGIIRALSVPLAFGIAASAALGEEVFFRGLLQRKIGWIWQGVAFAALHAGYGTVMQVVGPLVIGLLFGYLVKRGLGLWTVIAAHFVYNLTVLLLVLYGDSMGA